MNTRGVTLIELMMGVVTVAIIAAASAALLKAGIVTYSFSVRQNEALTKTRKALGRDGAASGIMPTGRYAHAVGALNAAAVTVLVSSDSAVDSYYVAGGALERSQGGTAAVHAESIASLAVNYYNMNSSGLIVESTAAASARLVTALVAMPAKTNKQKSHRLFSGTMLRNKP